VCRLRRAVLREVDMIFGGVLGFIVFLILLIVLLRILGAL
jgi:hypothetical protein